MNLEELTGSELRAAAFEAIRRELGPDGLVRFIAQNLSRPGEDYTAERQKRPQPSVDEIAADIAKLKARRGGSLAPPEASVISGRPKPRRKPPRRT